MKAIVIDASAVVGALVNLGVRGSAARRRWAGHVRHAPHLFDAEVGSALRRLVLQQAIEPDEASRRRRSAGRIVHRRHSHRGVLGERAWQLRDNLSFYDGLYVALAERLRCPLVTGDARLANAPGIRCPVEVV